MGIIGKYKELNQKAQDNAKKAKDDYRKVYGKQCPKCGERDLEILKKPSKLKIGLKGTFIKEYLNPTKNLNVCKRCGFSWEDR